jgi:hypothetical protein
MALLWVSSPLALDDPSLRMTFTLHDRFRHARSTCFYLHLNYRSKPYAGGIWSGATRCGARIALGSSAYLHHTISVLGEVFLVAADAELFVRTVEDGLPIDESGHSFPHSRKRPTAPTSSSLIGSLSSVSMR